MTVVYIDPSPVVREPLAALIRARGYEVPSCSCVAEAVGVLSCLEPKAIVIDPFTGGVPEGEAVLNRIRAVSSAAETPMIVLTEAATRDSVIAAARARVSSYLIKQQFSLSVFMQRLEHLITGKNPAEQTESVPVLQARDPEEAMKTLKPVISRSSMEDALDNIGDMKALSPCVAQVMALTREKNTSVDAIAKAIKRDQAISLKILRLANSSVYNRGDPVDSIKNAVVRIGVGKISQAVMNISVIDRFSDSSDDAAIDPGRFWEHAIAVGLTASLLARDYRDIEPDTAFTMGLMHDVGKLLLADALPDDHAKAVRTARENGLPLEVVEKRTLLVNHADLMDRTLRGWGFPKLLINPISLHHLSASNIRQHAPQEVDLSCLLALSNRFAHALMIGDSGNDAVYPTDDLCETLRVGPAAIERLAGAVREETNNMKFSLLSLGDVGAWSDKLETTRSTLADSFRPLFVSANPEIDAIRLFTEQLADSINLDEPNVAVAHIRGARYKETVIRKLLAKEEELGLPKLPLLLIVPSKQGKISSGLVSGRATRLLTAPFSTTNYIDAVNTLLSGAQPQAEQPAAAA